MKKRLGLDLGAKSIGWCLVQFDDNENYSIVDLGVRLFPSHEDGKATRRKARAARFQRRRSHLRIKHHLTKLLSELPCMVAEKRLPMSHLYQLRVKALDTAITLEELRSILFQLAKRRGFKSNRKGAYQNEEEEAGLRKVLTDTENAMQKTKARTYGEYLHILSLEEPNAKLRCKKGQTAKKSQTINHFPNRQMMESEFNLIRKKQEKYYPHLPWDQIHSVLFFQRPLKSAFAGKCTIFPEESRLPKASYLAMRFAMLQGLSHLRFKSREQVWLPPRELTLQEIQNILPMCERLKSTKPSAILKALKLHVAYEPIIQSEGKTEIAGMWEDYLWGDRILTNEQKKYILDVLLEEENEETALKFLQKQGFNNKEMNKLLYTLPSGYLAFSEKAVLAILDRFQKGHGSIGKIVADMRQDFSSNTKTAMLGYYAEVLKSNPNIHLVSPCACKNFQQCPHKVAPLEKLYGKTPNGVEHVALNQLRILVNGIIEKYGSIDEIVVELVRSDWDSPLDKKVRKENEKYNEYIRKNLQELFPDQFSNPYAFEKLKLFYELPPTGKECAYCDKGIGLELLLTSEIEIDHILPIEITKDNSFKNKILACRSCNREKEKRTPFEAFGKQTTRYERSLKKIPPSKRWRFEETALRRWEEKTNGWQTRDLNDTSMIAKHARAYLGILTPNKVYAIRGSLTATFRKHLRLRKDREDLRHHARDAFITSLVGKGTVQRFHSFNLENGKLSQPIVSNEFDLVNEFQKKYEKICVSIRPNHSIQGRLLEETAYGVYPQEDGKVEYRGNGKKEIGPRSDFVEIGERGPVSQKGAYLHVKAYKSDSYAYVDVWESLSSGDWVFEFTTLFHAFQIKSSQKKEPNQPSTKDPHKKLGPWRKVMRLRNGDTLKINDKFYKVVTLQAIAGTIWLHPLENAYKDYKAKVTLPRSAIQLKQSQARLVHIDPLGNILSRRKQNYERSHS